MGEAKRRGSFETRKAQALAREFQARASLAERLKEDAERRQHPVRLSRRTSLLLGAGLALAETTLWPRGA